MDDRKPYAAILRLRDDVRSLPEFAREHALADLDRLAGLLEELEDATRALVQPKPATTDNPFGLSTVGNAWRVLRKLRAERGEGESV